MYIHIASTTTFLTLSSCLLLFRLLFLFSCCVQLEFMQIHRTFVLFLALSSLIYPLSASSRHAKENRRETRQAEIALMEESERVPNDLGAGEEFGIIWKGRGRMDMETNDYQSSAPNNKHDNFDIPPPEGSN
ncbi:unnamed protein product [Cuscuta europaea]|uniref:Uncharacterized protein n=1 Tax=Cuscuta europaea TaxID=41803 RepID=A0A9P0VWG2_CUSEU|nr:unnamed protein product [Cuscuta europaea]